MYDNLNMFDCIEDDTSVLKVDWEEVERLSKLSPEELDALIERELNEIGLSMYKN